jgi:3-hydroxypropanoate dehydrogenase
MARRLDESALDQLFRTARTHTAWLPMPVSETTLRELVDLMKMGPTSANSSPARILFVVSREAKQRLEPHLTPGNRAKTMAAPVTAIVGYDLKFYLHLGRLFPHQPKARSWFEGDERHVFMNAFRNGTLQGAYLILAARALGLDAGPMSGFDNAGVDREFFAGTDIRSNFLCNLGHGDPSALRPRSPRFSFEDMARIL